MASSKFYLPITTVSQNEKRAKGFHGYSELLGAAEKLGYPFEVPPGRLPEGGDLWGGSRPIGPYLKRMLKAHLFELDKDYIIRDQNIVILSPNTGRTQERSRWSDGVHQVTDTSAAI